jgi:hypothetical protein
MEILGLKAAGDKFGDLDHGLWHGQGRVDFSEVEFKEEGSLAEVAILKRSNIKGYYQKGRKTKD